MKTKIILPTYVTTQPSTGKKVTYRPFTVKEEKSLLLALQEDNVETVTQAIKNVITTCTDVDPDKVPYYDVEFLFLQIRSKSVGEVIELVGSCDCSPDAKTPFTVDIADIKIEPAPKVNESIKILDTDYSIICSHPSITDFSKTFSNDTDASTKVVANCIKSVYTDDEVMNWNFEETLEFVESMTPRQQKNIATFLQDMPIVKLDAGYTCSKCSKKHTNSISGFESFFI